jgi:hypothetical protein
MIRATGCGEIASRASGPDVPRGMQKMPKGKMSGRENGGKLTLNIFLISIKNGVKTILVRHLKLIRAVGQETL